MPKNVLKFELVCKSLLKLYTKKNEDYGDSFGQLHEDYGDVVTLIKLRDKLNRLETIYFNEGGENFEPLLDSLVDLACYAIMGISVRMPDPEIKPDDAPFAPRSAEYWDNLANSFKQDKGNENTRDDALKKTSDDIGEAFMRGLQKFKEFIDKTGKSEFEEFLESDIGKGLINHDNDEN